VGDPGRQAADKPDLVYIDYQYQTPEFAMPQYFVQLLKYMVAWHIAEPITEQQTRLPGSGWLWVTHREWPRWLLSHGCCKSMARTTRRGSLKTYSTHCGEELMRFVEFQTNFSTGELDPAAACAG
jgi:hypothetical protein